MVKSSSSLSGLCLLPSSSLIANDPMKNVDDAFESSVSGASSLALLLLAKGVTGTPYIDNRSPASSGSSMVIVACGNVE